MKAVIVYNLGGQEMLHSVSLKHAMTMVHRGVARIKETITLTKEKEIPKSLELVKYVYAKWRYQTTGKIPYKKIGVLRRDNYTCAYCGKQNKTKVNTVDHIFPKWKGGELTWANTVAACQPCNGKKGGRTPKEAGMKLLYTPKTVSFQEAYDLTR